MPRMSDAPFLRRRQSADTRSTDDEIGPEDLLRRKLKFYFMNPCQKWKAKKKFPWKLALQIIKILLVTLQLWMFGLSRASHVDFLEKSTISFKHLFILNWTSALETMPYPPSAGSFAIYEIPAFYASVNYAMQRYDSTEKIAVGTYQFVRNSKQSPIPPMTMCNSHYLLSPDWSINQTYKFESNEVTDCFDVKAIEVYDNTTKKFEKEYNIEKYLGPDYLNKSIFFDSVNLITLEFQLHAIHLKHNSKVKRPDCYMFNITIKYDNTDHDGQMKVSLQDVPQPHPCYGEKFSYGVVSEILFSIVWDVVVIFVSGLSAVLCLRSLYRAHKLKTQTVKLFRKKYHRELDPSDKFLFLNMWYVLIIINDTLTITGSGFKLALETERSHNYEACSVLLGTGNLFVWFGVLRYLGFFDKYNILILTMKKAAPNVLRFLICAAMFYFGFTVCGWVVLGPYHIKFRHLTSASECLFSLVNGDDMYVTFSAIQTDTNTYIWWYSQIYLYMFISLFIYVILSVFIAVIMDTYETIKRGYKLGFPPSPLEEYIEQCQDDARSLFRSYSTDRFRMVSGREPCSCLCGCLPLACTCCNKSADGSAGPDDDIAEYGSLLT